MDKFIFTSESVTEGHPDKIAIKSQMQFWMQFWNKTHMVSGL